MNEKKKLILLIAVFIVFIAGASFLYTGLSQNYKPDSLMSEFNSSGRNNESEFDTAANNISYESTTTTESSSTSNETDHTSTKNQFLAPNFTVYDLEGNKVNLTDFFGKPIIVNFWASWCGPCKMEMPDFNDAYITYNDDIVFLMVNMTDGSRETIDIASSFLEQSGYSFPVYYDTDYSAAITYSVSSLPTTYFINATGNLVTYAKGAIDAQILQKGISMIYNN